MFRYQQRLKKLKLLLHPHCVILMYHRIGHTKTDLWRLSVSEENFEQQLQYLREKNLVISLEEMAAQAARGKIKRKSVAITFDDGYENNFSVARPLLEKYNLPSTFFITSKNIDSTKEFWWDQLECILLETPELPQYFTYDTGREKIEFDLGQAATLNSEMIDIHSRCEAFGEDTPRTKMYCKLWQLLTPLNSEDQQNIMNYVIEWSGTNPARSSYQSMSAENIQDLGKSTLCNIGVHTMTHPALSFHPKSHQQKEITTNQDYLKKLAKNNINLMAYPSGKYNADTLDIVKKAGIVGAVTTDQKTVSNNSAPHELGRFQVNNWSLPIFKQKLEKWFLYDD